MNLGGQVLLLVPLLLLFVGLIGLLRRRSRRERRSPVVSLTIFSVLAHVGLLFLLDLISIAVPVAEEHRELIENVLKTFAVLPSHPSPPKSWEHLPEGPPPAEPTPETADPSGPDREIAFAPELRGIEPTIREDLARHLPTERILFVPPPIPTTVEAPAPQVSRGLAPVEPEVLPPEPIELARVEEHEESRVPAPIQLPRALPSEIGPAPTITLPSRDPATIAIEPPQLPRDLALDIPLPKSPEIAPKLRAIDAEPVAFARDHLELTDNFALRRAGGRPALVAAMGGNEASEAAVQRGLAWLAAHQGPEGNWGLHDLHCQGHHCDSAGNMPGDAAATGLALMAFLGAGQTQAQGKHAEPVRRGLAWLVAHQHPDGDLAGPGEKQMYGHALATISLCEAAGMSGDEALRGPAARALQFIVNAQDPSQGGWRYNPRAGGDTSVVGWQIMALKSGEMAGFSVRPEVYVLARRWLDSVTTGDHHQLAAYLPGQGPSPAMTAEALLCRQYLGIARDAESMVAGGDYLKSNLPDWGARHSYYWYYATQVMYHLQGKNWSTWNGKLSEMLVQAQVKDGPAAGSWHPEQPSHDQYGERGGRLYETALSLLMLEVYYRNLPLYQQLGDDTPEDAPL